MLMGKLIRPKFSKELLNLRKIQETMARSKDYTEAHKLKLKADALEAWELGNLLANIICRSLFFDNRKVAWEASARPSFERSQVQAGEIARALRSSKENPYRTRRAETAASFGS